MCYSGPGNRLSFGLLSWSILKEKLVLYSYAVELGIKTAVERDALAVSG